MATLERAIAIAAEAHSGQVDKGGAPYILHPIRVMMAVEPDDRIAAILHDVLEDCPDWSRQRLIEAGFSMTVIEALVSLTRRADETYAHFIDRCGANPMARRVKMADLKDNSDISRIAVPTDADWSRLGRYGKAATWLLAMA